MNVGTVVEKNDRLMLQDKPGIEYNILNYGALVLRNKDRVYYDLVCTNRGDSVYKAYIKNKITPDIESDEFMVVVDKVVTTHMNRLDLLYGKLKDDVTEKDLRTRTRKREIVITRNIACYMINHFIGKQITFNVIADHYDKAIDRSNIYHSLKSMVNYRTDKELRVMIDNIQDELNIIYNNLKEE